MAEVYSVIVLGSEGVGKTCLVQRFTTEVYPDPLPDPGVSRTRVTHRIVDLPGDRVGLDVRDTPPAAEGGDHFSKVYANLVREVDCAVILYSVDSQHSFASMARLCKAVNFVNAKVKTELFIVGSKADVPDQLRQVNRADAVELARSFACQHFEVSAKTNEGVEELFVACAQAARAHTADAQFIHQQVRKNSLSTRLGQTLSPSKRRNRSNTQLDSSPSDGFIAEFGGRPESASRSSLDSSLSSSARRAAPSPGAASPVFPALSEDGISNLGGSGLKPKAKVKDRSKSFGEKLNDVTTYVSLIGYTTKFHKLDRD